MSSAAQRTFDRLDALSRVRALSELESIALEQAIYEIDAHKPAPGVWTTDEIRRFMKLIEDGMSIRSAAVLLGRTPNAGVGMYSRLRARMAKRAA